MTKNFYSIEHAKVDKETQQKEYLGNTLLGYLAIRISCQVLSHDCLAHGALRSKTASLFASPVIRFMEENLQIDYRKQPAIKNGRPKSYKEVCQTRILKLEDENDERSAGQQTRDDTSKVWIFLVEKKQNPSPNKLKNKFCCSFFGFRLQTICIWRLVLGCVKLSPLLHLQEGFVL